MYMHMYNVHVFSFIDKRINNLNIIMKTKYLCLKNNETSQNIIITVSISRPAGAPVITVSVSRPAGAPVSPRYQLC